MRGSCILGGMVAAIVAAGTLLASPSVAGAGDGRGRTACQSENYRYKHCRMETRGGVRLVAQVSSGAGPCIAGRSWGWDGHGVWVDDGCRAWFAPVHGRGRVHGRDAWRAPGRKSERHRGKDRGSNWARVPEHGWYDGGRGHGARFGTTIDCASQDYGRTYCPAPVRDGVQLLQQFSTRGGRCVAGRSWGWDRGGIWVADGCRARFLLRRD